MMHVRHEMPKKTSCVGLTVLARLSSIQEYSGCLVYGQKMKYEIIMDNTGLFIPSVNSFGISIFLIHGVILESFNVARAHMVRIFFDAY